MAKPLVLVLGCKGMLGHVVKHVLEETNEYTVIGACRNPDPTNATEVRFTGKEPIIQTYHPAFVINCIGLLVADSEKNPDLAEWTNSALPFILKSELDKYGGQLIHISTDCVFDGVRGNYAVADTPTATNIYGITKARGEITDPRHLTIRTSIIGPELKINGTGLLHWFLKQNGPIQGYTNVFWNGVTTLTLAHFIRSALKMPRPTGLVHVCSDTVSKRILLDFFSGIWHKSIPIKDRADVHSDRTLVPTYLMPSLYEQLENLYAYMVVHQEEYVPIYGKEWICEY